MIPFAVNVVQYPVPSRAALLQPGQAIRRHRELRRALNVHIWGTGGMSHQLQGRAGLINRRVGQRFLDR